MARAQLILSISTARIVRMTNAAAAANLKAPAAIAEDLQLNHQKKVHLHIESFTLMGLMM